MATEFNYKRAWDEYVSKEFDKLYALIRPVACALWREVGSITQMNMSLRLTGMSDDLKTIFDTVPVDTLAWASEVVYYYGHLGYGKHQHLQARGFYWKFQKLAVASVLKRNGNEHLRLARVQMKKMLKQFHDHKSGTEYDNEELLTLIRREVEFDALEIVKVKNINHKPDVFCITSRHFPQDGGIYIRPEQAPCGHCGRPYSEHTYDRALFVKRTNEDNNALKKSMQAIVDFCKGRNIRLDGFALVGTP